MAASVHPPIASFRLSRNQRITSIRLWQARTTMVASVSQARERGDQGYHAGGRVQLLRSQDRDGEGITVVSRRESERMPAVRKLLEVSGNWR